MSSMFNFAPATPMPTPAPAPAPAVSSDQSPPPQIPIDTMQQQQQVEGKEDIGEHKEELKKKERKKRGPRGRILLNLEFESKPKTPKPKTPKPPKPKKVIPLNPPSTKRKYTKRKLDNKSIVLLEEAISTDILPVQIPEESSSTVCDVSVEISLPIEKPAIISTYSRKKQLLNEPAKRVLDFNLDCNLEVSDSTNLVPEINAPDKGTESTSSLPTCRASLQLRCQCCLCRNEKVKPAFPKECKRIRTKGRRISRIAKANRRRLLPMVISKEDILNFFNCTMVLSNSFIPTVKRRKWGRKNRLWREVAQKKAAALQQQQSDLPVSGLDQSVIVDNENVTKGKKKQTNSVNKEAKPTKVTLSKKPKATKVTVNEKPKATKVTLKVTKERKNKKKVKVPSWGKNTPLEEMVDYVTETMKALEIHPDLFALHKLTQMEVKLDEETMQIWNLLQDRNKDGTDPVKEADEARSKWWKEQRDALFRKVEIFTIVIREFLGDRRFTRWKGSVVDSVVGVFLTQNVSDSLSSSAYMSVASRYPAKPPRENAQLCIEYNHQQNDTEETEIASSQGSNQPTEHIDIPTPKIASRQDSNLSHDLNQSMEQVDGPGTPKQLLAASSQDSNQSMEQIDSPGTPKQHSDLPESSNTKQDKEKKDMEDTKIWDDLRTTYSRQKPRCVETMDGVDWNAVRKADVNDLAKTIELRGQHNILAIKIKNFLDRIVEDHGSIDLEWLRDVPPEKAKAYLLSIHGLGLKSVECLRLLTLYHHAFPVDVNVGRIVIRLGWVPLQPLSEFVHFHLLENYPAMDQIQVYLWARFCHLNQGTLYDLHYSLITFGKVFCTKRNPHCEACPLQGDCKYYASKRQSSIPSLTWLKQQGSKKVSPKLKSSFQEPKGSSLVLSHVNKSFSGLPAKVQNCEPIIEEPPSPGPQPLPELDRDIEDLFLEDSDGIASIDLRSREFRDFVNRSQNLTQSRDNETSTSTSSAIVTLSPRVSSYSTPKQKLIAKLRTEHRVYVLPDSHPVLKGLPKREKDDFTPYLLAIWPQDESCQEKNQDHHTVPGTILIPCRTAMDGRFPLNGTYFQTNEVFVDDETSKRPLNVPTSSIWNLSRCILYCGTSTTSILKGLRMEDIRDCFWLGFICIRSINRTTREPKLILPAKFHQRPTSTPKKKVEEDKV